MNNATIKNTDGDIQTGDKVRVNGQTLTVMTVHTDAYGSQWAIVRDAAGRCERLFVEG